MSEPQARNREAARSSRGNTMLPWRANQENATAVVFGLFETGLGVIRSLGQQGVKVYGIDYKKDIGWYSRYSKPLHCPDPLRQEQSFLDRSDSSENDVPVILQEVIAGPDTNHLKYCSYTSSDGKIFAEFTLRKIRQYPVRFGVGSAVESIQNAELIEE